MQTLNELLKPPTSDETLIAIQKLALCEALENLHALGVVATVSLVPLQPFAMGNYEQVIDLRPLRGS